MRRFFSLLTVLMLCGAWAYAQERTVTGKVQDEAGEPVPFATITVSGTNTATTADISGDFTIALDAGSSLVVTAVGFDPKTVTPEGNTAYVVLNRNVSELATVVVTTALGLLREKEDLGYATAKIKAEQLNNAAPVGVAKGLQGKVSGLNITSINNGVFEDVKINLRGIRSLTGDNNPMLLLDGVPMDINFLSSLNPNDIANVNVLKGSSAAALYGPQAVNGVIVVTTKDGSRDGKPIIRLSNTTQLQSISFWPKFQYEFGAGGYGSYTPYENWSWGPAYDGEMVPIGKELPNGHREMVKYSPLKDERADFFNTGITMQNDVSFQTKDFFLSVQDVSITGIVPDDKARRTGVRLNSSKEYGKFDLAFHVNYIQENYNIFDDGAMSDFQRSQNVGLNNGLMNLIFNIPSFIPFTKYKDFENDEFADYNGYFTDYGLNPYFALDNWRQEGKNEDLLANIDLNFEATDWLDLHFRTAAVVASNTWQRSGKGEVPNDFGISRGFVAIPGTLSEHFVRSSNLSATFFANLKKEINDFRLNAVVGTSVHQRDYKSTAVGASSLVVPELFNVGNRTGELTGSSYNSRVRGAAVYASVGVNYDGWANLEVTGRNDWTSLLASNLNSFFYPGVSASLVLSDAIQGLKNSKFLSFLKVRAAWNKTANANLGPYQLAATFGQSNGFPYGSLAGYTANNTSYDPQIRFEVVESKEVGIEMAFLKNRINFEATYFHQDNSDQIIPIRVSSATGYTNSFVNAAAFFNYGVELDLRLTPLVDIGEVSIDLNMNATYNNSEVTSIYEGLDELFAGGYDNLAANYAIVGYPAFVFKATDYKRDSATGKVIVQRENGYPEVNPNTSIFGRTMPLWILGFNPTVSWRGLTFSAVAEYKGGHQAYFRIGDAMAWTGVSAATAKNHRERFVFPNSVYEQTPGQKNYVNNTDLTVANVNDFFTGVYRDVASNFLVDAASWRIREVSLTYDFPPNFLKGQNVIKDLSVAVNARNLFLWVPESNVYGDPDFNFTTGNSSGISTSQINPPTRIYGANITLTF